MDSRLIEALVLILIGFIVGFGVITVVCTGDETLDNKIKKEQLRSLKLENDSKEAKLCP